MALFTDGPISSIDDLTAQDSQLLDVANVEGIDLSRKLAAAQDELGVELESLLGRMSLARMGYGNASIWSGSSKGLGSVIVTPALRLWHTFKTLEAAYRDAHNNQLNDRYAGKLQEFQKRVKWAYDKLVEAGIGMSNEPMRKAAAPVLAASAGTLPRGTYYVSMAWVNGAGEEGACSLPAMIEVTVGTFEVRPGIGPVKATGWHAYAGAAPDVLVRQNASPIRTDVTWLQPNPLLTQGSGAGTGQAPSYIQPVPRLIQRG
jgi:hypothetical protein